MPEALTEDGQCFTSAAALARVLQVHRDQVRMWRVNDGAPDGLEVETWRRWLLESGRTRYAELLPAPLPAAEQAPPAAEQQTVPFEVKPEDEGLWRARAARAKAIAAEHDLAEQEGRLVERATWEAALRRLGAAVVAELLASKPWDQLCPELDALTPAQRQAIRAAYERWSINLRGRLAILPGAIGVEVLPKLGATR